jgi:TnpA family transposase
MGTRSGGRSRAREIAEACSLASYRQLAWTAAWHLREETYRQALVTLVNAQQRQPLAARFGAADFRPLH